MVSEGKNRARGPLAKVRRQYPLHQFNDLPFWMQHNQYIVSGYRVGLSMKDTLLSLIHLHNETLNVWTHLLGTLSFTFLMLFDMSTWLREGEAADKLVYLIYVISAQFLLGCSTSFHLFHCLSKSSAEYGWFARLDYIGISILITGSYYSPVYYMFFCAPLVVAFYISGITILMIAAICVTFHPMFEKPGYELIRASVFVGMAVFGVICIPHAITVFGIPAVWPLAWRLGLMGFFYLGGVVVYVSKFPERMFPGKFDCTFHSHAIWHCFVLAGAYAMYHVVVFCFENRFDSPCALYA